VLLEMIKNWKKIEIISDYFVKNKREFENYYLTFPIERYMITKNKKMLKIFKFRLIFIK